MTEPRVVAHRGASELAPENTAVAFDLALEQGADALELDVQISADGELIVWHDDRLDRTARRDGEILSGNVCDTAFDELALCDVGSWFNEAFASRAHDNFVGLCALRLQDALDRYAHRANLFIELKRLELHPEMAVRTIELIRAYGGRKHRILSTDAQSLIRMHVEAPDIPLVQLLPHRGQWPLTLEEIARYADGIGPMRSMIGDPLMATAKECGLKIFPYTVNDEADIETLFTRGIDGVITDAPATGRKAYENIRTRALSPA